MEWHLHGAGAVAEGAQFSLQLGHDEQCAPPQRLFAHQDVSEDVVACRAHTTAPVTFPDGVCVCAWQQSVATDVATECHVKNGKA